MLPRLVIAGSVLLLALPLAAQQQSSSSPQQNQPVASTASGSQKKDQPKKSTAQANPFPEAQSEAAAHQAQQPNPAPNAPQPQAAPQNGSPAKPNSEQNPFPEAQSEKAARQAQQGDNPAPPANSAAGNGDYSSSRVKGLDMPTTDATPPGDLPPSPLPYNPKLARKDVDVGDFYLDSGNWQGAYDRFLEANRSDPGNAEAVFGLADSARHLHRRDEALRNYRLYLSALPNGPRAKEVRKALKEMDAEPSS